MRLYLAYTNYGQLIPLLAWAVFNQGSLQVNLLLLTIESKYFAFIILSMLANDDDDNDGAVSCK